MMLNCLIGYLTPKCKTCSFWSDGSDSNKGIGCRINVPIIMCPDYVKAKEEDKKKK